MAGAAAPSRIADEINASPAPSADFQRVTGIEVVGLIVKHHRGHDVMLVWDDFQKRFRVGGTQDFKFEEEP